MRVETDDLGANPPADPVNKVDEEHKIIEGAGEGSPSQGDLNLGAQADGIKLASTKAASGQ